MGDRSQSSVWDSRDERIAVLSEALKSSEKEVERLRGLLAWLYGEFTFQDLNTVAQRSKEAEQKMREVDREVLAEGERKETP